MSKEAIEENGVITNMTETEYLEHLKEIHKSQLVGEMISGLKDNTCRAEFSALGSENKKDFTEISVLKENHCICKVKFYGIPYYDTNEIDFHWHTGNGDYTFKCDVTGTFEWFQGYETISFKGNVIYECHFHGGIIE